MDFSKMDFKKIIDINEIKKTLTRIENIAALAIVLFFFFPWVSMGFISMNGFGAASLQPILYLIPLLALVVVAMRPICQIPMVLKVAKLAAGALPIIGFVLAVIDGGGEALNALGFGVYLTVIAGVIVILGTLDKVQLKNAQPAVESCTTEEAEETNE